MTRPATARCVARRGRCAAALACAIMATLAVGGGVAAAEPADETASLIGLTDRVDGDQTVVADDEVSIDVAVALTNLSVGTEYRLDATLVKTDGGALELGEDAPCGAQTFTAEAPESLTSLTLAFDGSALAADCDATAVLRLARKDSEPQTFDAADGQAAISLVKPTLSVALAPAGMRQVAAFELEAAAECAVEHLVSGRDYELALSLVDEADETPLEVDGARAERSLAAGDGAATLTQDFTFDGSALAGCAYGVKAELTRNGHRLAEARSAPDEANEIVASSFQSSLVDGVDDDTTLTVDPAMTLVDRLACRDLNPARSYRAVSLVMDCDTGLPLLVGDGDADPDEAALREFYGTLIDAYGLRHFAHVDDASSTEAGDGEPSTGLQAPTPIDADALEALLADNETLLDAIALASLEFTPDGAEETVEVPHDFDGSRYGPDGEARAVTTLALLVADGAVVAADLDLHDGRPVTLKPPTVVGTLALDDDANDSDDASADAGDPTLVNTIDYDGVLTGAPYELTTILVDPDTGEDLLIDGEPVTATCDLAPTETAGTASTTIALDRDAAPQERVTAREELTRDGVLVARGGVRDDAETVPIGVDDPTSATDPAGDADGSTYAKTGLGMLPWLIGFGFAGSGASALTGWHIWRRRARW